MISLNKDVTEETVEMTSSVVKHNKFAERVFAYTDHLLKTKPAMNHLSQEAYIMFCLNKTSEWLGKMSEEEKKETIEHARRQVSVLDKKYQMRRKAILETRKSNLEKKLTEEREKQARKQEQKELIVREIMFYGLFQTPDQLEEGLEGMTDNEKIDALKAQLRFREYILQQDVGKDDKHLFIFSTKENGKRKDKSIDVLTANTLKLISMSLGKDVSVDKPTARMVGKKVEFLYKVDGKQIWYHGKIISTVPGYPSWVNVKYDEDDNLYVENILKGIADKEAKVDYLT